MSASLLRTGATRMLAALRHVEFGAAAALLALSVVIAPHYKIQWPGGGLVGAAVLLGAGLLLMLLGTRAASLRLQERCAMAAERVGLGAILAAGVLLQVVAAAWTRPELISDPMVYVELARRLVEQGDYVDVSGHRAFMPPGLPFYLSPFVAALGVGLPAIALANLALYLVGACALHALGRRLFGAPAGLLAAALFTLWPSRLLAAGVASKEHLTIAMVCAGMALALRALAPKPQGGGNAIAVLAGACFGIAALAQPGFMLLVFAVPLMCRGAFVRIGPAAFLLRCALLLATAWAVLLPWQLRNCEVFEGRFCGMATNGGSVFYRANNPLADGLWKQHGEVELDHLHELDQNRLGFELGKAWIREHPLDFAKLGVRKLVHLLGDDNYGAYWGILRATGARHEQSLGQASPARMAAYRVADLVSSAFWALCAAWALANLVVHVRQQGLAAMDDLAPLVYALLYSAAVFSVFESGSRQHMVAFALLLVLTASGLATRPLSQAR